jgi:hypothetical protein
MIIYQMTAIGDSEASSPVSNPTDARRVLYYLRRRSNHAASDDMITASVFQGDKASMRRAMSILVKAQAVQTVGR